MSEKWTKGPWEVSLEQLHPGSEAEGYLIRTDAFDVVSGHLGIRKVSDAHLIAAAPELYAVLKELCDSCMGECDDCQVMRILKKARGES
jgi:hypothetical protein